MISYSSAHKDGMQSRLRRLHIACPMNWRVGHRGVPLSGCAISDSGLLDIAMVAGLARPPL